MLRIAIVDDDIIFSNHFCELLKSKYTISENQIDLYSQVNDTLLSKTYDIVFLDILLEDGESFQHSAKFNTSFKTVLVYISNFDHFIYDAQKYNSYYYIRKDNLSYDLSGFFNKFFSNIKNKTHKLHIMYKGEEFIIPQDKIIFIEYYQKKIKIFVDKEIIEIRMSLKDVYNLLNKSNFYKLNASIILNLEHVRHIDKDIIMKDNHVIRFTQNSKSKFIKRFVEYKEDKMWS